MNLQVKNVKFIDSLSEETDAFSASIYLDGKRVGQASNRGQGGCNDYQWFDREAADKIYAWAEQQDTEFDFDKLDQIIDKLCTEYDLQRQYRRITKGKTAFRLKTDPEGQYRIFKVKFNATVKAEIVKRYGDQLAEILNEKVT